MSDAFGQQPVAPSSFRVGRSHAPTPNLAAGADDHVEDLAAAYALGALEPDERDLVEFHIRFCPRCAAVVDADRQAVGALPFLSPPALPRLDAKAALFVRVAAEGRPSTVPAAAPVPVAEPRALPLTPMPTLPASRPEAAAPVTAPTVTLSPNRGAGWYVGLVSLPLLLALVATGFWGTSLQRQLAEQGAQVAGMQAQLANFGAGGQVVQLSPGQELQQAQGQVVFGADQMGGMLQVDLNATDAAGTYDVYVVENGTLVRAGEVRVDAQGQGQTSLQLAQPFSAYEDIQVQPQSADDKPVRKRNAVLRINSAALGSTGSQLDAGAP